MLCSPVTNSITKLKAPVTHSTISIFMETLMSEASDDKLKKSVKTWMKPMRYPTSRNLPEMERKHKLWEHRWIWRYSEEHLKELLLAIFASSPSSLARRCLLLVVQLKAKISAWITEVNRNFATHSDLLVAITAPKNIWNHDPRRDWHF